MSKQQLFDDLRNLELTRPLTSDTFMNFTDYTPDAVTATCPLAEVALQKAGLNVEGIQFAMRESDEEALIFHALTEHYELDSEKVLHQFVSAWDDIRSGEKPDGDVPDDVIGLVNDVAAIADRFVSEAVS